MAYSSNSTSELRSILRNKLASNSLTVDKTKLEIPLGLWVAKASKAQCLAVLRLGRIPVLQSEILPAEYRGADTEETPKPSKPVVPEGVVNPGMPLGNNAADLGQKLAEILGQLGVNEDKVREIAENAAKALVEKELEKITQANIIRIEQVTPDGLTIKDLGVQHVAFERIIRLVRNKVNLWLVGPAGSGKTTLVEKACDALGYKFFPKSVGPEMLSSDLFGYMDANGRFVEGILYQPFTQGGVLLLDEIDRGNPAILTSLNATLANGYASFPNGVAKAHPDFRCVACANTFGLGATAEYVGALSICRTVLDRFYTVEIGYDAALEESLSINPDWLKTVRLYRKAVEELKLKVIVGPRTVLIGQECLLAGETVEQVIEGRILRGLDAQSRQKLTDKVASYGRN